MKNRLYLDIHAIQNLPPSNVNRDDTGSPKTAQYGGVRRARVSSQSWKRAMRKYFNDFGGGRDLGVRTLHVPQYVANKILELDSNINEEEALKMAVEVLKKAGLKIKKENKTGALFFIGDTQAEGLAQAAIDGIDKKKDLQEILKDNPAVDIALFGRMVADDPNLNEDASSQVSHAISTHPVEVEFDYFTATDDRSPEEHAGAGMIGTVEYNSSTLYRYANIAVHELLEQLGNKESLVKAISLYIEAFVKSMPTGKVNTFANQTLPQAVLVTLRTDRPVNLVSAFEKPVISREGYVKKSIEKLFNEIEKVEKFMDAPEFSVYLSTEELAGTEGVVEAQFMSELIEETENKIEELLED